MYLVHTELDAHCTYDVVLGTCENMREVVEIIWNYSRLVLRETGETFEEHHSIINISKITNEQYSTLLTMYHKYKEIIEDNIEKCKVNAWTDESYWAYFWNAVYDHEDEAEIVFSEEDCDVIREIINNSVLIE